MTTVRTCLHSKPPIIRYDCNHSIFYNCKYKRILFSGISLFSDFLFCFTSYFILQMQNPNNLSVTFYRVAKLQIILRSGGKACCPSILLSNMCLALISKRTSQLTLLVHIFTWYSQCQLNQAKDYVKIHSSEACCSIDSLLRYSVTKRNSAWLFKHVPENTRKYHLLDNTFSGKF